MTLNQIAAIIATVIFAIMVVFQLLLASGAPIGHLAWGGKYKRLPYKLRFVSLVSVVIFILACFCVMERAGLSKFIGQNLFIKISVWILAGLFGLSTLGNLMSQSTIEKRLMTPVALTLTITCVIVAFGIQ